MIIAPMIHSRLRRDDLARLVAMIAHDDRRQAQRASAALDAGDVDALLDSPAALDAVRGRGGAPGALPLPLLWYIPVRAALRASGESDIELADYAATLPIAFVSSHAVRRVARGETTLAAWTRAIGAVPGGTIAQGERAAYCGALALWWVGCFPERVARRGGGPGMIRAYVDFADTALRLSARILIRDAPQVAGIYHRAADRAALLQDALNQTRADYLGREAQTSDGRLNRFLTRLDAAPGEDGQDAA